MLLAVTPGAEEVAGARRENLERPTGAVEHGAEESRSQIDGERRLLAEDRLTNGEAGRLLEHLERGQVASHAEDLGQQACVADPHDLAERSAAHAARLGDGPRDPREHGAHRGLTR